MIRETVNALAACVVTFVLCAVAYPAAVWGLGQLAFPRQAEGSLIYGRDRTVIGSELIAQPFASDRYFHPRPSAVDYKADATGGSNLGPRTPTCARRSPSGPRPLKATADGPAPVDLGDGLGLGPRPAHQPRGGQLSGGRVAAARRLPERAGPRPDRRPRPSGPGRSSAPRRGSTSCGSTWPSDRAMPDLERIDARERSGHDHRRTGRPTPEQFLNLIRRQERGRLKVYLGSAAGVGKTYAMLREGHRLKQQGVDVAIGLVETHGRAETAEQVGDLEVIPPRAIEYRGVTLREMDLDAILARRPTVCLVDELAHTNAPGSRHAKRYQDVEELLRAGIHVITTVNIQHLESLYDEVERATGVKVKERLPDRVLAEADQIVNVDVSAEDLLERLQGRQGLPARARRAGAGELLHAAEPDPARASSR